MNSLHLNYLHAMGVQCWASREAVVERLAVEPTLTPNLSKLDINALQSCVEQCELCALSQTRRQTVFGAGNPNASWMLITEAPNQAEESAGQPFMGRAGQLLTEMLLAVDLSRQAVYLTHVLKCRPESDRNPQKEELEHCEAFLDRQIELVQPKIILAVGRVAAQKLLGTDRPLSDLRGKIHHYGESNIPLLVVYHPAYLLRSLTEKCKAWDDLQLALKVAG